MANWEDNENEVERANQRIFRDVPFLGIKDEYFDEPQEDKKPTEPNYEKGTQPDPAVAKLLNEVAELTERHGDAFFDPQGV